MKRRTLLALGIWSTLDVEFSAGRSKKDRRLGSTLLPAELHRPVFQSALPIWPVGRSSELNVFIGFRASFQSVPDGVAMLRLTGSTIYRIFVNGIFAGHGPARGPHGFFRVDELPISQYLSSGTNIVALEVAGYNINSFYLLSQPAFVQVEVVQDGTVLASSAGSGILFQATGLHSRTQRVERFSVQRSFSEAYSFSPGFDAWRHDPNVPIEALPTAVASAKTLLPRWVPFSAFLIRKPVTMIAHGVVQPTEPKTLWRSQALIETGTILQGYLENELALIPTFDLQRLLSVPDGRDGCPCEVQDKFTIAQNGYVILDFGTNLTGFIQAGIVAYGPTRLYFVFDEMLTDGDVDFKRLNCVNNVTVNLMAGEYQFEAFEPNTFRFLKIISAGSGVDLQGVGIREYANPNVSGAQFASSDERINQLFAAGVETFRQSAVDIFMDCPSRERAGWLCDSFFTARVAHLLIGSHEIEQSMMENFLLAEGLDWLPDGMLPMCYPADNYAGLFIPTWALWFVLQLEEYKSRSGDRKMVDALQPKVISLFGYFRQFLNRSGLLESLKNFIFIEASLANSFTHDVSFPANMLYAGALDAAARLYHLPSLSAQAEQVRSEIRRQSFDGTFFVDNAIRDQGELISTTNRTEVCQYYAFLFGIATPDTHAQLWERLRDEFGPSRELSRAYPDISPTNAFMGNVLRLELLSKYSPRQQIIDDAVSYYLYQAQRTGTLWENNLPTGSLNHGFASHLVNTLYRDALGLHQIDSVEKSVSVRFTGSNLSYCKGSVPVPEGIIALSWTKDGNKISYRLDTPPDYDVRIVNLSGLDLSPTVSGLIYVGR